MYEITGRGIPAVSARANIARAAPKSQPYEEPQTVVHKSPECLSSSEEHPVFSAVSDDEQNAIRSTSNVTETTHIDASKPVSWDDLPCFLQSVIPSDEKHSYIIEECS